MPITPTGDLDAGENSPSRLVLVAAIKTAEQYELPQRGKLRQLVRRFDELAVRRLAKDYAAMAKQELTESDIARRMEDYDVAVGLARSVVAATTLVWKVRQVAQGAQSVAPSSEVWELFAMITTVVYGRAREKNDTLGLVTFVDELTMQISDL